MYIYVRHYNAYCSQGPEESIRFLITGVVDGCEQSCQSWKLNSGLLKEEQVLTTNPSLQPSKRMFGGFFVVVVVWLVGCLFF